MCARVSARACACACVRVCVCVKLDSSAARALIPAARIDPKRHFSERVALLLRWGAGDPFNLGGWSESFADVISINADADVPGNWHPLWEWKRTLPTAEEAAAEARDAAKRKMAVAAQMKAQAQAEKDFDLKYKRCRKCTKLGKEMRSVSDLLKEIDTAKRRECAQRVERRCQCGPRSGLIGRRIIGALMCCAGHIMVVVAKGTSPAMKP